MNKPLFIAAVSLVPVLFAANSVYANTNARKEISTAIVHAGYAEKMTDVNKVHLHLHHVINCLVGTHGAGFDTKAGDPCLGMGNGAIHDYTYKVADKVQRDMLQQALEDAHYGLMTNRLKIAHNAADLAEKNLKKAEDNNL
jgi:hypothetical protein